MSEGAGSSALTFRSVRDCRGVNQKGTRVKSIVFFNNKGGVGKTTLACNIASHLASEGKQRILLVDCDPQCNSTQLILDSSEWSGIYFNQGASGSKTILDAINPIIEGEATIDISIEPILSSGNRFQVDLLAGHPRMAIVEDLLSKQWSVGCGGELG